MPQFLSNGREELENNILRDENQKLQKRLANYNQMSSTLMEHELENIQKELHEALDANEKVKRRYEIGQGDLADANMRLQDMELIQTERD